MDIGDDNRQMLEPAVIAARIARQRPPRLLDQLDRLFAEPESHAGRLGGIDRHEGERPSIETRRPAELGDRYHDTIDRIDRGLRTSLGGGESDPGEEGQSALHRWALPVPSRSSK